MAVADLSRTALEMVLERLDALSLVDKELGEERYSLHPLTRAYVRDELLADANTARETGMRFARYWLDYAKRYGGEGKESYKTYDRLEAEWANLEAAANWLWEMAAVQASPEPCPESSRRAVEGGDTVGDQDAARMLNDLADALWQFLWFDGRWDELVQLSAQTYEAARALQDWSKAGWRAYRVAVIHWHRARTDDAVLWADRCAEVWARGGGKDEQAEAMYMRELIAKQRKDHDQVWGLFEETVAGWHSLGFNERMAILFNEVAILFNKVGKMSHEIEAYDKAERAYCKALELARKIDDKERQAGQCGNLGGLALDREQWAEARQWYEREPALAREVGRVELIAHAQYGLSRAWEAEGRADLALPLAQETLKIYERLQHRDLAEARELVERLRGKQPSP